MKDNSNTPGKTVGAVGIVAAALLATTYLVLPPGLPSMVNPWTYKSPVEGTSNWDIVYKWCYRDDVKGTNWTFYSYTTNTTALTIDATNEKRFYTITEYFLTGFPAWMTNSEQFRWRRTNL